MAIEIKKENKSNLGSWIMILLIVVLGVWILFQFIRPVKLIHIPRPEDVLPQSSYELVQAQLDIQGVLQDPVFQTLSSHISWPPSEVPLGKSNPFRPF